MSVDPRIFWWLFHVNQVASWFSPCWILVHQFNDCTPTYFLVPKILSLLTPFSGLGELCIKKIPSESIILGENRVQVIIFFFIHRVMTLSNTKFLFDQQNTQKFCSVFWGHGICQVSCSLRNNSIIFPCQVKYVLWQLLCIIMLILRFLFKCCGGIDRTWHWLAP